MTPQPTFYEWLRLPISPYSIRTSVRSSESCNSQESGSGSGSSQGLRTPSSDKTEVDEDDLQEEIEELEEEAGDDVTPRRLFPEVKDEGKVVERVWWEDTKDTTGSQSIEGDTSETDSESDESGIETVISTPVIEENRPQRQSI